MAKRIVFRVKPNQGRWRVTRNDRPSWHEDWKNKYAAVERARLLARNEWAWGDLSQLVIYGRNGRFQKERTYGRDPVRRKG